MMNPYEGYLRTSGLTSYKELYRWFQLTAKSKLGLDEIPFSLSDLENPPGNIRNHEILRFMNQCSTAELSKYSDTEVKKLVKYLKENPPKESYENPKIPDGKVSEDEKNLIKHIFTEYIDLPGSRHNINGHLQYYSCFFIDIYFGNFTEFDNYVKSLSKEKIKKLMKRREGYCQFSPVFSPILGLKMVSIEDKPIFTKQEIQKIRLMYNGCNENEHLKILKKLIKYGADVNAHDINGFRPLHYAVMYNDEDMVKVLLKHGANPNSESRVGERPLSYLKNNISQMSLIDTLLQYNAKLVIKEDINKLRTNVEINGSQELAVRVRESHPREKEECEKCVNLAEKKCSACGLVYYCTPACQKLDWKFHKITCHRNLKDE